MGYRSDVVIRCERRIAERIEKVCKEHNMFPNRLQYCKRDDSFTFTWEWIKWYDCFDEVKAVEDILYESEVGAYKFVRSGEETGDIEEHASESGWDYSLYPVVTIENDEANFNLKDISSVKDVKTNREKAGIIIDMFSEMLDKYGITIPLAEGEEERCDEASSVYGVNYYALEDEITKFLDKQDGGASEYGVSDMSATVHESKNEYGVA